MPSTLVDIKAVSEGPKPIDFAGVEALRKHMLLNTTQMSKLLSVSRVTYSGWIKGKPIRKSNNLTVRTALQGLFTVLKDHEWPKPEVIAMPPAQRYNHLLELLHTGE